MAQGYAHHGTAAPCRWSLAVWDLSERKTTMIKTKSVLTARREVLVHTNPTLRWWLLRPGLDLAVAVMAALLMGGYLALPGGAGTLLAGAVLVLGMSCTAVWIIALRLLWHVRRRPLPGFPAGLPAPTGALLLRIAVLGTAIAAVSAGGAAVVLTVLEKTSTWPVTVALAIGLGGSATRLALMGRPLLQLATDCALRH